MVRYDDIGMQFSNERFKGVYRDRHLGHDEQVEGPLQRLAGMHQVGDLFDSTKIEVIAQRDAVQPCFANLFFEIRIN